MRRLSATIQRLKRATARLRYGAASVGLLLLLSLGVLEPLACIIHCELMEHAAASRAAHGAAALCAFMQHESTVDQAHAGPAFAAASAGSGHVILSHASIPNGRSAPGGAGQPQPFHEMALVAAFVLGGAGALLRRRTVPFLAPPQRFTRPPLRPPTVQHSFA